MIQEKCCCVASSDFLMNILAQLIMLLTSCKQDEIWRFKIKYFHPRKDVKSLNVIKEMGNGKHVMCNYRVIDALGRFAKHSRSWHTTLLSPCVMQLLCFFHA